MMHESVPTKYDLIKSKDFYLYQMMHESVPTKYVLNFINRALNLVMTNDV